MSEEKVTFVLSARDQATATVKRLKGELGAMGGSAAAATGPMGKLGAATGGLISPVGLAIGGAVALGTALLGAATAAMDEERGVALLTAAIRANDPANVANIKGIEATITERQNLAFADDEQRESLGALIAVTKDSNKALELQRTAMDLARLKGMSLADASTLIGKVYGGNLGILARYGIQLDKGTTATEALAEIQKRAAGQAEAFADTTAGAMQSAGLAFDDVVEDIGAMLLPVLTDLAEFARDDLIPALRDIGSVVGPVLGTIGDGIASLIKPFADAGAGIDYFAMNFGEQGDKVHAEADRLGTDFETMKQRILAAMKESGLTFEEATAKMAADAKAAAVAVSGGMTAAMRDAVDAIRLGGPVVATEAGKVAGMLPAEISKRVADIRAAGRNNVVQFAAGMLDAQNDPMTAIEAMQEAQKTALTRGAEIARLKGQLTSKELAAGLNDSRVEVRLAAQAARAVIVDRLAALGVEASGWGSNIGSELAGGLNSQYGVVKTAAGGLAGAVRGQIGILSEPKDSDSPLRGITEWGGNIDKTMAKGMVGHLGVLRDAAGAAAGALVPAGVVPAYAGGGGYAGGYAGGGGSNGGGGTPSVVYVQLDGHTLARALIPSLTREQRRQAL